MKYSLLFLAAAATSISACSATTGDGSDVASASSTAMSADGAATDPAMTPTTAPEYLAMAGASDLYERQSSQLALSKSQSNDVRQFAQMMISDHGQTTQTLMQAAQAAGMTPPTPQLMPMQADMIAQLQPLSGAAFDQAYLSQQLRAHQMALALHSNYASNGDTDALKSAASTAVPIIQQHLDRVQQLQP